MEGSEIVGEFDLNFRAIWGVSPSDLLCVLRSCLRVRGNPTACLAAFLRASRTLVPYVTGSLKISEGLLRDCERCLGKSSPYLLVSSFRDGEVLDGLSSLLSDEIYFVVIFPLIL